MHIAGKPCPGFRIAWTAPWSAPMVAYARGDKMTDRIGPSRQRTRRAGADKVKARTALLPENPDATAIRSAFLADEKQCIASLLPLAAFDAARSARVSERARAWVEHVRGKYASNAGMESFLHQYDLSTQEGVLLMCVAEALLRIPDAAPAERLIRDKLSRGDWERHLGASASLFVNASTWGLMLPGRLARIDACDARDPKSWYERIVARAGEPVVRIAIRQAMKLMAEQVVMGRTIDEALARGRQGSNARFRYSFDMLG